MSTDTLTGPDGAGPADAQVFDLGTGRRIDPAPVPVDAIPAAPDPDPDPDPQEDPDAEPPRPVDPKTLADPTSTAPKRHSVLAGWAKDGAEFRRASSGVIDHHWYLIRFHAVRIPFLYLPRLAARSPLGLLKAVRVCGRWVADRHGGAVVADAVGKLDAGLYLRVSPQHNRRVRARLALALPGIAALAAGWVLAQHLPRIDAYPLYLTLISALGVIGRPADKPLLSRATESGRVEKLTSEIVLRALGSIGIAKLADAVTKGRGISFPTEIARDGAGYRAVVDLPYGVTADEVIERRIKLASGLRRPLGCVWPEPVPEDHEGRLVLWVGDKDMAETTKEPWPLLKRGTVDLFKPIPIGTDPRGRWVFITLMYASVVIGAVPRMGKTFFLRLLLLAAALDPRVQLMPFDLKGTGDFRALAPVSYRYRAGDDVDDIEYGLTAMRELRDEMRRRTKVIQNLPVHLSRENKVTPELAADPSLGLHPILLAVDECQRWFENKTHGEELTEIAEDITRRGPALGIIGAFATQRPDAKSLPTGISGNAIIRFALKILDQVANDMVLGTSKYKQGIKATLFRRRDLGVGYLVGEGDDPQIVASSYIDGEAAEKIVARARTAREQAGTITGYAAGVHIPEATTQAATILDDLSAVMDKVVFTNGKIWGEELLTLLTDYRPDPYQKWKVETLTSALKPHGIKSVNASRRDGETVTTRKGYDEPALTKAVTERD
ncbi:MAG TPA: FtsK/SpoIIIE domain-containing protein [Actinocrinis sp.]|nr:FtsK/SpoIIIE domain-containing protein [Actinocrinis sp.]